MTLETITLRILKASEGMVLTDGKEYGTTIYLGKGRNEEEFHEITHKEYDEIVNADMPEELREGISSVEQEIIDKTAEE